MANLIRRSTIQEGTRYATYHWYFESDGNEGELKDYVLLDPNVDFTVPVPPKVLNGKLQPIEMTLRKAWWSTSWFDFVIGWQSNDPDSKYYLTLPRDAHDQADYREFNGLKDYTDPSFNPTGQLIVKTIGFAPLGSSGHLVLEMRKD